MRHVAATKKAHKPVVISWRNGSTTASGIKKAARIAFIVSSVRAFPRCGFLYFVS
jgi:hypothetical protein